MKVKVQTWAVNNCSRTDKDCCWSDGMRGVCVCVCVEESEDMSNDIWDE